MYFKSEKITQIELRELWGEFLPPLTSEQINLSIKVWHKIKARKQRSENLELLE